MIVPKLLSYKTQKQCHSLNNLVTWPDKATMKKLQRELNSTNIMMVQLRVTAFNDDNTLRRLDKATLKELNKAIKQ